MKRKRHPITLLEVMIVILLIGLIGGVLSYNLKGTLDRGKKFRTEEGITRLREILDLEMESGKYKVADFTGSDGETKLRQCVVGSGFIPVSNVDKFLKDGWGESYIITEHDGKLHISSHHLEQM